MPCDKSSLVPVCSPGRSCRRSSGATRWHRRACQPGLQVELHLDRIAGADRLPLAGGPVCWVPAAGQADAQAMAAWLLQRLALQADSADLADSTDAADPVEPAAGRLRS